MLQATAEILKHCPLRLEGFLGRIGGDDFIIFIGDYRYEEYCRNNI